MKRNIFKKIKKVRVRLEECIKQNGLSSSKTRELSDEIDALLNEYEKSIDTVKYSEDSKMEIWYKESYLAIKKITRDFNKFPSIVEWNYYAKENNLLSNISVEYISRLNWNYLRTKILRELNMKI